MVRGGTKLATLVLQAKDVNSSVKSFQLSKTYIKRLMKIAVINIAFQRIEIPNNELDFKTYENISYVVPKRKASNKFIRIYHSIATGILDAIDKDYLKQISLYIIKKETREALETYQFKLKYNKQDTKSDQKPNKVKEATMAFLKGLTELPGKKWTEDKVELYIELNYNDDTPTEYEPPNFEAAKKAFPSNTNTFVKLGAVNTGFHKISTWGKGINFSLSRPSTPAPSLHIQEDLDNEDTHETKLEKRKVNVSLDEKNREQSKRRKLENKSGNNKIDELILEDITIVSSEDYVSCPCKWDLPKEYETVKCSKCFDVVHVACHGYLTSSVIDTDQFMCYSCAKPKNPQGNVNHIMKFRIILYGINKNHSIPDEITFATEVESDYIQEQLEKFGIGGNESSFSEDIDLDRLQRAIQVMFRNENSQYFEAFE